MEGVVGSIQKSRQPVSSINLNELVKRLKSEDPSNYRQIMEDLKFTGRDPKWFE